MSEARGKREVVINVGSGPEGESSLPPYFANWRILRVDIDPHTKPDVQANATDLSAVESGSADALWSAHCLEHLYAHDVSRALAEFHRVIRSDGFVCLIVPDLQTVAHLVASDKMHETLYNSASGPVTPHDVIFGFGPALVQGRLPMAHRCGFTPSLFLKRLQESGFGAIVLRRKRGYELMAVARKTPFESAEVRDHLMAALEQ